MRGSIRSSLLTLAAVCALPALAVGSASAAKPELLDKPAGKLLRDVNKAPTNAPDGLEFANNGNVELVTAKGTYTCTEIELGTTVVKAENPVNLAVPGGVFEGDECKIGAANMPIYFATLPSGAVGNAVNGNVAKVSITEVGGVKNAGISDLKFSWNLPGVGFCTANLNGLTGSVANGVGSLVEDRPPNLNVQFTKIKVPITASGGVGCPAEGELTGNFFLETPSTTTDTAFVN
jgi:hypothetical protein